MNVFLIREAIASVALSHPEDHECEVCRAAGGDEKAFTNVVLMIQAVEASRKET